MIFPDSIEKRHRICLISVRKDCSKKMEEEGSNQTRRRFKRWAVSIPCTVTWEEREVRTGTVLDISFDGALIRVGGAPSEGTEGAVRFAFRDQGLHLLGRVTSEVIHSRQKDEDQIFGVKFETSAEKFWLQLTPVIQTLLEEASEIEKDSDG
jgi:hypothetical protein